MRSVNFDCSGLEDGDYSFSQSCQNKYVSCVAGAPWERFCPDNLSFDFENRICDRLENIIACGGSPPTLPPLNGTSLSCYALHLQVFLIIVCCDID
jgi:hypothetical protein